MIASRVVVVSEVVAELAFRMKLPRIHDVDVSALYPTKYSIAKYSTQLYSIAKDYTQLYSTAKDYTQLYSKLIQHKIYHSSQSREHNTTTQIKQLVLLSKADLSECDG